MDGYCGARNSSLHFLSVLHLSSVEVFNTIESQAGKLNHAHKMLEDLPGAWAGHKGRADLGSPLQPTGGAEALAYLGCASTPVLVMNSDTSVARNIRELHRAPI